MVETIPNPESRLNSAGDTQLDIAESDSLEYKVLKIIQKNPFASIREMQRELNIQSNFTKISWWKVFKVVRSKGLLSRRSRFKYVRDLL